MTALLTGQPATEVAAPSLAALAGTPSPVGNRDTRRSPAAWQRP
jgi:hypothetical protein